MELALGLFITPNLERDFVSNFEVPLEAGLGPLPFLATEGLDIEDTLEYAFGEPSGAFWDSTLGLRMLGPRAVSVGCSLKVPSWLGTRVDLASFALKSLHISLGFDAP